MMLLENNNCPGNETPVHYELKQIAKYLAWQKGCRMIAEEAFWGVDKEALIESNKKGIVDVIGARVTTQGTTIDKPIVLTYGYEAKASRSDFKAGYSASCDYNYVIVPKGMIKPDEVRKNVGLIEVDFESYTVSAWSQNGIELIKKPRKMKNTEKYDINKQLHKLYAISWGITAKDIFKHNEIEIQQPYWQNEEKKG